jgi:hypothetical protein
MRTPDTQIRPQETKRGFVANPVSGQSMPAREWVDLWSRFVLVVLLIVGSIGAPRRSTSLGDVWANGQGQTAATRAAIRVRAVTSSGSSQSIRAVVGLAAGGVDEDRPGSGSRGFPSYISSPANAPDRPDVIPVVRPRPPRRC